LNFGAEKLILGFKRAHPEFGAKAIARDGKHPKLKGWQQRIPENGSFMAGIPTRQLVTGKSNMLMVPVLTRTHGGDYTLLS